jgi:hypothetical protein
MRNILKIAALLDQAGNYKLSDKIFDKIVLSQFSAILAPPQPSVRFTPILTPPVVNSPQAQNESDVTGIYKTDIQYYKRLLERAYESEDNYTTWKTLADKYIIKIQNTNKYNPQTKRAFQMQALRINEEFKLNFNKSNNNRNTNMIYALLKKYNLTENALSNYKTISDFTKQWNTFIGELNRTINIDANVKNYLDYTYSILTSRWKQGLTSKGYQKI